MENLTSLMNKLSPKEQLKVIEKAYYNEAKARAKGWWDGITERLSVVVIVLFLMHVVGKHYGWW